VRLHTDVVVGEIGVVRLKHLGVLFTGVVVGDVGVPPTDDVLR